ncbi:MAG: hypothetical protein MJZ17_03100 [Bacteroidales bacterium]|nr:hypothetical protein [Bacteroidales bacterium]
MKSRLTILFVAAVLAVVSLVSCMQESIRAIEDRLGRLEETVESLSRIQTGVQSLSVELATLANDVAALKERISSQQPSGDDAYASRVQALEEAVHNLQAWASSLDGIGLTLEGINMALASHSDSLSSLDASLRGMDATVTALQTQVEALQAALEAASQDPASGTAVAGLIARVNALEPKVSTLQESLSALAGRIDSMELELADIDGQIAGISTTIAGLQAAVEALQASSTSSSAQLQAAIAALESRVAALEALKESLATREWAEGTFATLAAQQQTAAALAGVQAAVVAALDGMPEGKSIAEAIAAASQSVRSWVGEQLAGYYTIGDIEGKLTAMKTELEAKVAALDAKADSLDTALTAEIEAANEDIAALSAALESAKAAITTAYTAAITAAKTELDGKITVNTTAINAANTRINTLEGKVDALVTDVAALQSRLDDVEGRLDGHDADIEALKAMIQSVVFVPRYQGGCAVMESLAEVNSFTLDYEVLPRKAGKAIADLWNADGGDKSILKMTYRQVATRAGLPTLDIKNVAFDASDSLLNVTISLANVTEIFRSDDKALAVSLEINTGATMVSSPYTDIDIEETANCYIVSKAGEYKFDARVRGNGWNPDGTVADPIAPSSAKVLWESFGTDTAPTSGDLISSAILESDGYVKFTATNKTGNAVIAAVDGDGKILWSWHIWLAGEQPQGQVYNNGAGTMMDRNLGATTAAKGNPGALGLLYQWGRKDPFLGSSAIDSGNDDSKTAKSVTASDMSWEIKSSAECLEGGSNTLDYSIANPTVFLTNSNSPNDWYCTDAYNQNDALWKSTAASGSSKTMYDPCPTGWRVPDGGNSGVWHKAFSSDAWSSNWDSTNKGMDFGNTDKKLGTGIIWYPAAGNRFGSDGKLYSIGSYGYYWSCTNTNPTAYSLNFGASSYVNPSYTIPNRASGNSVRCLSE